MSIVGPFATRDGTSLLESVRAKFNLFASNDRREGPELHGWKMSDIAELCGSSVSTVKRRLARAIGRFTVHARREASLDDLMEARDWTSR